MNLVALSAELPFGSFPKNLCQNTHPKNGRFRSFQKGGVLEHFSFHHIFDWVCDENGIEHRLTKINHPLSAMLCIACRDSAWTNGQVERMNRTIKDATVKRSHYDDHEQLRRHHHDFIDAYNFGRRLKTLKGLTPYKYICKQWTIEPERFTLNPIHQMPGLSN